jgi:integrase
MFERDECRRLIDATASTPELRAMILLALNCGFGNADCTKLPVDAVDLDKGWVKYARPKTGVDRRCPLWPETVDALRVVLGRRKQGRELVFVAPRGATLEKNPTNIIDGFGVVMDQLGLPRNGRGFYALRHVFRTIADATRDFPAIRLIMGHADDSMDAAYRERIDDSRLKAVTDHVREWLFGSDKKNP